MLSHANPNVESLKCTNFSTIQQKRVQNKFTELLSIANYNTGVVNHAIVRHSHCGERHYGLINYFYTLPDEGLSIESLLKSLRDNRAILL